MSKVVKIISLLLLISSNSFASNVHVTASDKIPQENFDLSLKLYEEKEFTKAFELTKKLADAGEKDAEFNLGFYYFYGIGVKKDYNESFKYFKLAANKGSRDALYNLGELYYLGLGTPKNLEESAKITKDFAEQNDPDAQFHLGMLYKKGLVYPKDTKLALKYLELASQQNSSNAQFALGKFYLQEKDFQQALKFFNLAANNNSAKAQRELAKFYQKGIAVTKDGQKAKELLKLAKTNAKQENIIRGPIKAKPINPSKTENDVKKETGVIDGDKKLSPSENVNAVK